MQRIRRFLGVQAVAFWLAALVHAGMLFGGYEHREATIAESVIASVLTLGLAVSLVQPRSTRLVALVAQGFALLGTCVGIFTIVIGVGPQSTFDVALHLGLVALLIAGLVATRRVGRTTTTRA